MDDQRRCDVCDGEGDLRYRPCNHCVCKDCIVNENAIQINQEGITLRCPVCAVNEASQDVQNSEIEDANVSMMSVIQNKCHDMLGCFLSFINAVLGLNKVFLSLSVILLLIGYYLPDFPAYVVLPIGEVQPVKFSCRPITKLEDYKNKTILHRTICTFGIFHYDLLDRNNTYFMLDIDIDIPQAIGDKKGRLFTIKMMYLNKEKDTFHRQRNMYWAVTKCKTTKEEQALCLEDIYYKTDLFVTQKLLTTTGDRKTHRLSFLCVMNNNSQLLHIYSPIVLFKDVIFLQHYYEGKSLKLWVSLAEPTKGKYVRATIRSGNDVKVKDLLNAAVITNSEIATEVVKYPFRYLQTLWQPSQ